MKPAFLRAASSERRAALPSGAAVVSKRTISFMGRHLAGCWRQESAVPKKCRRPRTLERRHGVRGRWGLAAGGTAGGGGRVEYRAEADAGFAAAATGEFGGLFEVLHELGEAAVEHAPLRREELEAIDGTGEFCGLIIEGGDPGGTVGVVQKIVFCNELQIYSKSIPYFHYIIIATRVL